MTAHVRVEPILVLEDDASVGTLITVVLESARVTNAVEMFTDADSIQRRLVELATAGTPPVLCVLDLHVPGGSGLAVLAYVRADPTLSDVPVVVVSGSGEEPDIDRAYELGVSAYLVKPAGVHALADLLGELGLRIALLPATSETEKSG